MKVGALDGGSSRAAFALNQLSLAPWADPTRPTVGVTPRLASPLVMTGQDFVLPYSFFLLVLPEITQIIQVDLDLKYKANIRDLFEEFDSFKEGAVIGIAREMQPVYRYGRVPRARRGEEGMGSRWPYFLFSSDQPSEQSLGRNSLPAVIPAGEFNLRLVGQSEHSVQHRCGFLVLTDSHKAVRAKFLITSA